MFEADLTFAEPLIKNHPLNNMDDLRIRKINRTTHALNGTFTLTVDLNEDTEVSCLTYKKSGNDYKLLPYKFGPKPLCTFTKEEKYFYLEFVSFTNFPPVPSCKFRKGVYKINNYIPDIKKLPPFFESENWINFFPLRTFLHFQIN